MFFSPNSNETVSNSFLPGAFESALLQVNEGDSFYDAVSYAAQQAGCEFLFEVPGSLFNQDGGRAAVIRSCPNNNGGDQLEKCILYIIFDGDDGVIRILEEFEVPNSIQAMTHSYSNVLELLTNVASPRSHPLH